MRIWKIKYLEDLYHGKLNEDYDNGLSAANVFGRIGDCLKRDFEIKVLNIFQWIEERSPNGVPGLVNHVWPVGLISTSSQTSPLDSILNYQRFKEFELEVKKVSNSSGGVNPEKIGEYLFTLSNLKLPETYHAREIINEQIINQFGEKQNFRYINGQTFNYTLIEGEDEISGGRFMIELGTKPIITKNIFGIERKGARTETSLPNEYYTHN